MIRMTIWAAFAAITAFLMVGNAAFAQGNAATLGPACQSLIIERQELVGDLLDPAFSVYVSPQAIGRAVASADPGALTDVALQLAEGERVLLRSRKGITAEQALTLAFNAAIQKHDKAALERIALFADTHSLKSLGDQATAALKLADGSRSLESGLTVPIDSVNVEEFVQLKIMLQYIQQAKLTDDSRFLAALEQDADTCIPDTFRPQFDKLIGESRANIRLNTKSTDKFRGIVDRLVQASRFDDPPIEEGVVLPTDVTGHY